MNSIRRRIRQTIDGFTIVELITTIVVIAILASITVVGYGVWRQNIAKSEVQSELKLVAAAMKNELNFKNAYPTSLPASFSSSKNVTVSWAAGTTSSFCINAVSNVNSQAKYYITESTNQPTSGACTIPVAPTPTIVSGSAPCGNNGGATSWANVTLTWTGQPASVAPTYRVYQGTSMVKSYANTSSSAGNLSTTFASSQWAANGSATLTYTIRSVNTQGVESGNSNSWSQSFLPYDC